VTAPLTPYDPFVDCKPKIGAVYTELPTCHKKKATAPRVLVSEEIINKRT